MNYVHGDWRPDAIGKCVCVCVCVHACASFRGSDTSDAIMSMCTHAHTIVNSFSRPHALTKNHKNTHRGDAHWVLLLECKNEEPAAWPIPRDRMEKGPFVSFRIYQTDKNCSHEHYLTCSGLELWGDLHYFAKTT